jgi:hypothetical protein
MELILQNHSSYPRIGDKPSQQRLRRAHAAHERGEIDAAEFAAVERALIHEILSDRRH